MPQSKVFRGLQALRAVAAILVLISHSGFYASERLCPGLQYWGRGGAGVDIFFVLSGFVMIHSSVKLFSDPDGWFLFAERRILRIVPIYWIVTTVKLAVLVAGSAFILHAQLSWFKTLASYLFLPTRNVDGELKPLLGVGWTLNFEMFFYALFTVALRWRINVYYFIAAVLVPLAVASAFVSSKSGPAVLFYLNPIVLEFFFGMLIARYILSHKNYLPSWSSILLVIAGLIGLLVLPQTQLVIVPAEGIWAAMIVLGAAALEIRLVWIPDWLLYLGDASYVLYLSHPLIAPIIPELLKRLHMPYALLSMFLSCLLAVAAACIIHRFIERPMTEKLRSKMSFSRRGCGVARQLPD